MVLARMRGALADIGEDAVRRARRTLERWRRRPQDIPKRLGNPAGRTLWEAALAEAQASAGGGIDRRSLSRAAEGLGLKLDLDIQTVHAAKGLEADYVILLDAGNAAAHLRAEERALEAALGPLMPEGARGDAEERRVSYVALTRARRKVYVVTPGQEARRPGRRTRRGRGTGSGGGAARTRRPGRALGRGAGAVPGLRRAAAPSARLPARAPYGQGPDLLRMLVLGGRRDAVRPHGAAVPMVRSGAGGADRAARRRVHRPGMPQARAALRLPSGEAHGPQDRAGGRAVPRMRRLCARGLPDHRGPRIGRSGTQARRGSGRPQGEGGMSAAEAGMLHPADRRNK